MGIEFIIRAIQRRVAALAMVNPFFVKLIIGTRKGCFSAFVDDNPFFGRTSAPFAPFDTLRQAQGAVSGLYWIESCALMFIDTVRKMIITIDNLLMRVG